MRAGRGVFPVAAHQSPFCAWHIALQGDLVHSGVMTKPCRRDVRHVV
jgi:hypothetical protein